MNMKILAVVTLPSIYPLFCVPPGAGGYIKKGFCRIHGKNHLVPPPGCTDVCPCCKLGSMWNLRPKLLPYLRVGVQAKILQGNYI